MGNQWRVHETSLYYFRNFLCIYDDFKIKSLKILKTKKAINHKKRLIHWLSLSIGMRVKSQATNREKIVTMHINPHCFYIQNIQRTSINGPLLNKT